MRKVMLIADKLSLSYVSYARRALDLYATFTPKSHIIPLVYVVQACRQNSIDTVVTDSDELLAKVLLATGRTSEGKVQQWAGACIAYEGIRFIITRSFAQIATTSTGRYIFRRHVYKHLEGQQVKLPELEWEMVSAQSGGQRALDYLSDCMLIAIDIETKRMQLSELALARLPAEQRRGLGAMMAPTDSSKKLVLCAPIMDMVGYYGIKEVDGKLEGRAFVMTPANMEDIYLMRKLNNTKAPKVFQNGNYDNLYFLRYNSPVYNWLYDTYHFYHCWQAELPRKLDFLASMFLPNYEYWKDEISNQRAHYNAKDVYNTAWIQVLMLLEAPDFVKRNYLIEFRKNFPNLCMAAEGLKVDEQELTNLHSAYAARKAKVVSRIEKLTCIGFNPGSSQQVLKVMNGLSPTKWKSTDEKTRKKWALENPLCGLFADLLDESREVSKAISTYLTPTLFEGRMLYSLDAGGTKTGRAASRSSGFWVGTQIQNQDNKLKSMYIADDGWVLAACDNSQSESRTTAYISGDEALIETVETAKDFHSRNASLFFGVPEDEIVKIVYNTVVVDGVEVQQPKLDKDGKLVKDKSLRDLAKRVNHGANYNMAQYTLIQTMGKPKVLEAARILKLPYTSAWQTATYLLEVFNQAYPKIKADFYEKVITDVRTAGMLVGATGWTRVCHGKPSREKSDKKHLNEYVAHPPQSLSVMMIDDALFDFWIEYQINRNRVRLKAQVHDEIVFQSRPENVEADLAAVSEYLRRPVEVNGKTLIIPNDGGAYGYRLSDLKN